MGQKAGGDINEIHKHDEVIGPALIMAAHLHAMAWEEMLQFRHYWIVGLTGRKCWKGWGNKSREVIERHPRVISDKLMRIAKTKSEFRNKTEAMGKSLKM